MRVLDAGSLGMLWCWIRRHRSYTLVICLQGFSITGHGFNRFTMIVLCVLVFVIVFLNLRYFVVTSRGFKRFTGY